MQDRVHLFTLAERDGGRAQDALDRAARYLPNALREGGNDTG
jgi:hypothetical protein